MHRFARTAAAALAALLLAACSEAGPPPDAPSQPAGPGPAAEEPSEVVCDFLDRARRGRRGYLEAAAFFTERARPAFVRLLRTRAERGPEERVRSYRRLSCSREDGVATVRARVETETAGSVRSEVLLFGLRREGRHWRLFRFGREDMAVDFENFEASMAELLEKAFEKKEAGGR